MSSLKHKRVLVTGGASGIGAAAARHFLDAGAQVAVLDLDAPAGLPAARSYIGSVAGREAWADVARSISAEWGGLDLVFLNAGVMTRPLGAEMMDDPMRWMTPKGLQRNIDVNLFGVIYGTEALLPLLRDGDNATIIVNASGAALAANNQDPYYTMSKYAALGYARSMAPLLSQQGITMAAVCPMAVNTALTPPDLKDPLKVPGRVASTPEQVAADVFDIATRLESGDVWIVGGGAAAYRYSFAPIASAASYMDAAS